MRPNSIVSNDLTEFFIELVNKPTMSKGKPSTEVFSVSLVWLIELVVLEELPLIALITPLKSIIGAA